MRKNLFDKMVLMDTGDTWRAAGTDPMDPATQHDSPDRATM